MGVMAWEIGGCKSERLAPPVECTLWIEEGFCAEGKGCIGEGLVMAFCVAGTATVESDGLIGGGEMLLLFLGGE